MNLILTRTNINRFIVVAFLLLLSLVSFLFVYQIRLFFYINKKDYQRVSAYFQKGGNGNIEFNMPVIEQINSFLPDGWFYDMRPIELAINLEDFQMVEILINSGVEINFNNKQSLLWYAISNLIPGVDIHNSYVPKHKDMSANHKIILLLIKNGAKLKKGEFDDKDILEVLRKYGGENLCEEASKILREE